MKEQTPTRGWSKKWIKIFFCMICTMLCYLGVLVLTIGTVARMQYELLDVLMDIRMYRLILFLLLVGALCLVLAFIGFLGTWRENRPLLYTFCSLLVVFSLMECTVAFIGYTQRDRMETEMESNLWLSVNQYPVDVTWQPYVDSYQMQLKCCGVHNYTDWLMAMPPDDITEDDKDLIAQLVPLSCCDLADTAQCTIYDAGCHSKVYEIFYETGNTVITNTLGAVILQLLGAAFAFFLVRKLRLFTQSDEGFFHAEKPNPFAYSKLVNIAISTEKM
ncbi:CD63 antigen [Anopheles gambiae]|uniref:Tetraspanin n=1 Tax=Anopheles coluzzii TaxID=1518534 RepID=A0A8W7PJR5_ANOCL|nr:CD63 antigen [Anopheles gambiae]XP_061513124.1 CD63 antigen [Anopheles gambiae]XP_061513125.1 CD63 antigen [Anopheles gambiae]XP_061513126.1 CD63 antigen [Anopheles gambiae]XP_061513127.1 CD63 antigen [Anopheles gambiae]XP_061513128.1 CD63 antigen [Anopheles gambiae]